MPFRLLDLEGVANYLHLTPADIEQRVKNREIPFEKRGDRIVFRKAEIDAWASQRILGSTGQQLADYHQETTRFTRKILPQETMLPEMLKSGAIASAMTSKTKASVLRDLVALAEKTGHAQRSQNPAGQPGGARRIMFHGGAGRIRPAASALT